MRSGGTGSIGFVVADISNPFFATAMRGVSDVAREEGYETILINSDDRVDVERNGVRILLEKQLEGAIVSPTSVMDVEHLKHAQQQGMPIVLLDRHSPVLSADSVVIDNQAAARDAVAHLLQLGHRRIGLLASVDPEEGPELVLDAASDGLGVRGAARPSIDRIRGYVGALQDYRVSPSRELMRYSPVGDLAQAGREADALLSLRQRPSAIFASDNVATQVAFTAARRHGLSIPGDLSLVGFDDLDWTVLVSPPLTVVAQSPLDMGRLAANACLPASRAIADRRNGWSYLPGSSCGPAPANEAASSAPRSDVRSRVDQHSLQRSSLSERAIHAS
jgi:LacI family transcriptional regulator